ncbi:MAG: hypothetical protein QXX20_03900 [Candidatus Thermoplasmatota archaeon]
MYCWFLPIIITLNAIEMLKIIADLHLVAFKIFSAASAVFWFNFLIVIYRMHPITSIDKRVYRFDLTRYVEMLFIIID